MKTENIGIIISRTCVQGVRMLLGRDKVAWALLSVLLLLGSCSRSEIGPDESAGESSLVEILLTVPDITASKATLSASEESSVKLVDILVFDHASGAFKYAVNVNSADLSSNGSGVIVPVKLDFTGEESIDLWVLANVSASKISDLKLTAGDTKESIAESLVYTQSDGVTQAGSQKVAIPMFGVSENLRIQSSGANLTVSISLLRSVSRIDVVIESDEVKELLELHEVRLYHQIRRGLVIPTGDGLESYIASLSSADANNPPRTTVPSFPADLDQATFATDPVIVQVSDPDHAKLERSLYAFETHAGSSSPPSFYNNTCLVLGTRVSGIASPRYFRADFVKNGSYIPLIRNRHYVVRITSVDVKGGHSTPELALNGVAGEINVKVEGWLTEDVLWEHGEPEPADDPEVGEEPAVDDPEPADPELVDPAPVDPEIVE